MKVCEFFCERRNGLDWIGLDWRVAIIMCHCLLKCFLAQSVESKPNETMGGLGVVYSLGWAKKRSFGQSKRWIEGHAK